MSFKKKNSPNKIKERMGPNLNINQKNIREKTIKKIINFFLKKHGQVLLGLASQASPLD